MLSLEIKMRKMRKMVRLGIILLIIGVVMLGVGMIVLLRFDIMKNPSLSGINNFFKWLNLIVLLIGASSAGIGLGLMQKFNPHDPLNYSPEELCKKCMEKR